MGIDGPTKKKTAQILFCKNHYSKGVKVENWDYSTYSEPKDNYVYRDQLSNHRSTYNRLGADDHGVTTTETRAMLAQVYTKTEPVYSFKPLVNFTSYPCTDNASRNRLMKKADLAQLPPDYGVMDYMTTHQDDYRNPYPSFGKPLTLASPPWMMYRTICSDTTQNYGTAPPRGDYMFLDSHTPIGHIRKMRLNRFQSFNPATCLRNFPEVEKHFEQTTTDIKK